MSLDRLSQIGGPSIVQEKDALTDPPNSGAVTELVPRDDTLRNAIGEPDSKLCTSRSEKRLPSGC